MGGGYADFVQFQTLSFGQGQMGLKSFQASLQCPLEYVNWVDMFLNKTIVLPFKISNCVNIN